MPRSFNVRELARRWRGYWGDQRHSATLARGAIGSLGAKVAGAGLTFLLHLLLTRVLGEIQYGDYITALEWMNMAALIGGLGFSTATVRFVAVYLGQAQWGMLRGYRLFSRSRVVYASVTMALVFYGGAWLVLDFSLGQGLLVTFGIAALLLPVYTSLRALSAELMGLKRVVLALLPLEVLRPGLILLCVLLVLSVDGTLLLASSTMLLNLAVTGLLLILFYFLVRHIWPSAVETHQPGWEKHKWFATARAMLLVAGFNTILSRADILMVSAMVGTTEAGIYAVAGRVAGLLIFVLVAVNNILAPMVADLHKRKQGRDLQKLVTLAARIVFACSVLGGLILIPGARLALGLFGEAFTEGTIALWILVGGQVINAWAGPAVLLLNMTGHEGVSARILGVSAGLNLVANGALIPYYGIEGAALGTGLTLIVWNVWAVVEVWRHLNIMPTAFSGRVRTDD